MAKTTKKTQTSEEKQQETAPEKVSDVGKEVAVNVAGASLVVKVGDGYIVPDFADAMARAIEKNAYVVAKVANEYYHKQINKDALRASCAFFRDSVFDDVK